MVYWLIVGILDREILNGDCPLGDCYQQPSMHLMILDIMTGYLCQIPLQTMLLPTVYQPEIDWLMKQSSFSNSYMHCNNGWQININKHFDQYLNRDWETSCSKSGGCNSACV
jgi:hypothetical protein